MSRFGKYSDPRWLALRQEILERDNHACTLCKSTKKLQVHHLWYVGENPWDQPEGVVNDHNLVTLCKPCHERVEEVVKTVRMLTSEPKFLAKVERLIKQWVKDIPKRIGVTA